jgi:hypothetical protein
MRNAWTADRRISCQRCVDHSPVEVPDAYGARGLVIVSVLSRIGDRRLHVTRILVAGRYEISKLP